MDRSEVVNTDTPEKEKESRGRGNRDQVRPESSGGRPDRETSAGSSETPQGSDESPVRLTRIAAEKLREALSIEDPDSELRVRVVGRGCGGYVYQLGIDHFADGDTRYTSGGVSIIVDVASLSVLRNTKIDYVDTEQGSGFVFSNPQDMPHCEPTMCGGCPRQEN